MLSIPTYAREDNDNVILNVGILIAAVRHQEVEKCKLEISTVCIDKEIKSRRTSEIGY
jgi:hypothetical protein